AASGRRARAAERLGRRGLRPALASDAHQRRGQDEARPRVALPRIRACVTRAPLARDDLIQIKGTIVEALAGGNLPAEGRNGKGFLAKIGWRTRPRPPPGVPR